MLKFLKENVEIMCVRPRSDSEVERIKEKRKNNEEILKLAESITEYECSNCFIQITSKEEYKKKKINKNIFGFCSEDCYKSWLKMPRVFTKINKNYLILNNECNLDGL